MPPADPTQAGWVPLVGRPARLADLTGTSRPPATLTGGGGGPQPERRKAA
jgi:hypothetical protein